mgnify:CR=1 FL=1
MRLPRQPELPERRRILGRRSFAGFVGISPDPESAQAKFSSRHNLPFPLLSDADHAVMEAWGVWGEKKNYGKVYTGVIRSTVVVAPDGTVALAQYNVRATGHVKRLRAALGGLTRAQQRSPHSAIRG